MSYLVEAADDICYRVLDIEDAIQLHILKDNYLDKNFKTHLKQITKEQHNLLKDKTIALSVKNGLLRGKMIGVMIDEIIKVFIKNYEPIMKGEFNYDLLSKTKKDSLCQRVKKVYEEDELKEQIYRNDRNLPLELGAYSVLKTLLETSMEAAYEIYISRKDPEIDLNKKLSYKTGVVKKIIDRDGNKRMEEADSLYEIVMLFLDYITGMTDDYATYVNKQLIGLGN